MFKTSFITQDFFLQKPIMTHSPIKFEFAWLSQDFNKNIKFEYLFGNVAFILLFIAVLLYWFDFSDTKSASKKVKNICMVGANASLTLLLLIRWWESGHFPLSNLYESLIGLSWGFTAVHLIVTFDQTQFRSWGVSDKSFESRQLSSHSAADSGCSSEKQVVTHVQHGLLGRVVFPGSSIKSTTFLRTNRHEQVLSSLNDKIGTITAPTALLTSVFATFFLPEDMLRVTTLIPALKSNWLTMHVTLMIFSYAFLLIGSLLSMAYCAYKFSTNFNSSTHNHNQDLVSSRNGMTTGVRPNNNPNTTYAPNISHGVEQQLQIQSDIGIWLNTTSYRILGLGFPLLTIGILSGAVWANEAWGSYWSWDPKETWALITWLVFAIYFHSRYNRSSDNSPVPASIASIGFFVIWVCYLGVNLLGSGLHSYGWFAKL